MKTTFGVCARSPGTAWGGGLWLRLHPFLHLRSASAARSLYRSRAHGVLGPVSAKEGKSLPWKAEGCSRVHLLNGPNAGP